MAPSHEGQLGFGEYGRRLDFGLLIRIVCKGLCGQWHCMTNWKFLSQRCLNHLTPQLRRGISTDEETVVTSQSGDRDRHVQKKKEALIFHSRLFWRLLIWPSHIDLDSRTLPRTLRAQDGGRPYLGEMCKTNGTEYSLAEALCLGVELPRMTDSCHWVRVGWGAVPIQ
ncbi:hypothetical protein ONS95_002574 [Cadophora gregata]|uniref:uncharacterized protein n=1 Tax=Cadophora gregata TaxID=51156 RepID=UPI0026DD0B52|nr:uncharacterized protein ONS95_002574 [Cadophora gregata]KAK0109903.1 hypothetical protein ONS95_002574 [Cadophora gregata]